MATKQQERQCRTKLRTQLKRNGDVIYDIISDSGEEYRVVISQGRLSCTCIAGSYGRACHHKRYVISREYDRSHGAGRPVEQPANAEVSDSRVLVAKMEVAPLTRNTGFQLMR